MRELPKDMLGDWALDWAACGEQASELGMTIEPRTVLLYEHGFTVQRVTRQKDGKLKSSGYSFDDSGRARDTITLELTSPDTLILGSQTYYRCKK